MGLTQACRALRKEFRPLYIHALRHSVDLEHLDAFIESFETPYIDPENRAVLRIAKHMPFPTDGVDILPLIKYMELHAAQVYPSAKGGHSAKNWGGFDFVYMIRYYFSSFCYWQTFDSRPTSIVLRIIPPTPVLPHEAYDVQRVLSISVPMNHRNPISAEALKNVGDDFIQSCFCRHKQVLQIEIYCGTLKGSWTIKCRGHNQHSVDYEDGSLQK
jgi:hypothetical protein